jgi:hypothetical protein
MDDYKVGYRFNIKGDKANFDFLYPRQSQIKTIEVGLEDVRAADSIQISYDFVRDGYSIKQASTFRWDINDKECDEDWQEVAFIQAWARKQEVE